MLAERINALGESPVREILKLIDLPGMISFAGGLPAPDSFPDVDSLRLPTESLQYGASEGEYELRQRIADSLQQIGLNTEADRILILSGSQQGIDLVAKLCIDAGCRVAIEAPTYVAALQVFNLYGARYNTYTPDNPLIEGSRLTYTIPTFQNPTGYCYTSEQRSALAAECGRAASILFEDDPYRELVYDRCERMPVCSYVNDNAHWIYQSSFSKVYAPGLRLGYLTCSKSLFPYLVQLKQAADLHSCRLSQHLILQLLERNSSEPLIEFYRQRRDHFNDCLREYFGDLAEWQLPAGGLFFWLTLKQKYAINTKELLQRSIKEGVAFMPGESFYPAGSAATKNLRLNFSYAEPEVARAGLKKLAQLVRV